ncbi:hypothetical protein [Sphingomonas adhaesiva]|uniref:hypothetical protein n=1 Tax=Sphingomonas adhaesiva TaxID=28212 RepID=UPI002FF5EE0D
MYWLRMDEQRSANLAIAEVQDWLRQRAEAVEAQARAAATITSVDQKVAAFRLLFPSLAAELVSHLPSDGTEAPAAVGSDQRWDARSGGKEPITAAVVRLLSAERGGRTSKWLRGQLLSDPDFVDRIRRNANILGNSVARLIERKQIVRVDNLLYHPTILNEIRSGRVEEEQEPNVVEKTFSSVMQQAVAGMGGSFTAAEAVEAARNNPFTAEKLQTNPSAVYSWLSRLVQRGGLIKDGDNYTLRQRDGTLNGNAASAPVAGRGPTLPFENPGSPTRHG